jgi:hypothetical protein
MQVSTALASAFHLLGTADLLVDGLYGGNAATDLSADPISKLLPVGNAGGIRIKGSAPKPTLVALVTSGDDIDWPDSFNPETGELTYFGDNKTGGKELHDTPRSGNVVLRNLFDAAHSNHRLSVAPVFVFRKEGGGGRNYRFLGVAVPGSADLDFSEDLVAVWRTKNGLRFQNYRATFTILDVAKVPRRWISDVLAGNPGADSAPRVWLQWANGGPPKALLAPRSAKIRSTIEQLPKNAADVKLISDIHQYFSSHPNDFEHLAAYLVRLALPAVASVEVTRQSRDGGRDAIGKYRVGKGDGSIVIDFAIEAKCYGPGNSVGVKEMSRLISRLRHRQFGVLVPTSFVSAQTYTEIVEDGHPVIVIAARDIAELLRNSDIPTTPTIFPWLEENFPVSSHAN